ncbi:MAG: type II toxin-antitoxin system HicB family antitoxin [Deltaproteobacteria bacterium]|nr:type II toxin-antitoxin system HicB family antitoxin [Deltaproteobacteria bacterium]
MSTQERKPLILSLDVPVQVERKAKHFVIGSPDLDVWTQGETKQEAEENFQEALTLFLESCIEAGTLFAVLQECGFTPMSEGIVPKRQKKAGPALDYINVAFPLFNRSGRGK